MIYSSNCIICGNYTNNNHLFCKDCFIYIKNINYELKMYGGRQDLKTFYFNLKETCEYSNDIDYIKEACLFLYAIAMRVRDNFEDYYLINRVENDIEYLTENIETIEDLNFEDEKEKRFFSSEKEYYLKTNYLTNYEKKFYNAMKTKLDSRFILIPQVNLQSIVETDTYTRNDELYRNIDFGIFESTCFTPLLMIEINGREHKENAYKIKRDNSVKQILEQINVAFYTIENEEIDYKLEQITNEIKNIVTDFFNI